MSVEGFLRDHRDKVPTPGGCWKLVTDYSVLLRTAYVLPSTDKQDMLLDVFRQRMIECAQLPIELEKMPAATIAELKKNPVYSPTETQNLLSPEGQRLLRIGAAAHEECIDKFSEYLSAGIKPSPALRTQVLICQAYADVLSNVTDRLYATNLSLYQKN